MIIMKIQRLFPVLILAFSGLVLPFSAFANVVGADTQNFNPTNDGLDFVTVHSSETLTPGLLNMGFFLNYAVNSLPNYEDAGTQKRTNFRDSLISSDLNFAFGIRRGWEAGLSFPAVLSQKVDSDVDTFRGYYSQTGLTELRAMTKARFWGDADKGFGAVLSVNINQIGDNPFLGTGAGPTFNFELVGDKSFGKFAVGLNAGIRLRDPGEKLPGIPIQPFGNQYIASTAASYLIPSWDTKVIAEIFASWPAKSREFVSDRDDQTAEFLLGMKHDINRSLAFHAGAGTEVIHGTSSPDWRVYTGINWVIGPLFSRPNEVFVRVKDQPLRSLEDLSSADPFAGQPEMAEAFIARDVLFEFNKDTLNPKAIVSLKRLVDYLRRPPGFKSLVIEGHTDSVGSVIYNLDLSQRRADSVRRAMVELGLPAARVRGIGYGASRPIADNGNFQGRQLNRRVEFKVKR
ncbi:MAG: OmpA family protein [Bdellovibrionales bacterium]|nr:OmpA family protein [Bdellovibrionales bacterium]